MAGKIFINYRRDDVAGDARGISDGLAAKFGKSNVFMDVDNLLAGQRFDRELEKALAQCDVLIAVMGPRWMELLTAQAQSGERDYVREEIAGALAKGIVVIPVRAGSEGSMTPLPRMQDLPSDIRDLVLHQKQDVAHERFRRDIADLIASIGMIRRVDRRPTPWGIVAAGAVALIVAAAVAMPLLGVPMPWTASTEPPSAVPKPGETFRDCPECPEMVVVPGGSFMMGSPASEAGHGDDEGPQHKVTIADPFAVGKLEVTRDQFAAFVSATDYRPGDKCWTFGDNKFEERGGRSYLNPGYKQDGTHPAVCVNWDDAKAYATWLSKTTGKTYRLLTEAEWEYAARAGTTGRFSYGENTDQQCRYANGRDETAKASGLPKDWTYAACKDGYDRTAPSGSFKPNAFGLYDMHGNVWEWVEDCYQDSYNGAADGGSARTLGDCSGRVLRGGSWRFLADDLRSANRNRLDTSARADSVGFRVGRTLTP